MAKIKVYDTEWLDSATDSYLHYRRRAVGSEQQMREILIELMHAYRVGLVPGSYSCKKTQSEHVHAQIARLFPVTQGYIRKIVMDLSRQGTLVKVVDGRRIRSLRFTEHYTWGYEDVSVVDFIDTFIGHIVEVTHGVLQPWMPFAAKKGKAPEAKSMVAQWSPPVQDGMILDLMVPAAMYDTMVELANKACDARDAANAKLATMEKQLSKIDVDRLMWKDRAKKAEEQCARYVQQLHPASTKWGDALKKLEARL